MSYLFIFYEMPNAPFTLFILYYFLADYTHELLTNTKFMTKIFRYNLKHLNRKEPVDTFFIYFFGDIRQGFSSFF